MRDDGDPNAPVEPLRRNVEELLRRRDELDAQIRAQYQKRVAVIFTDIKGSTQYFERYGDLAGRAMVQRHNDLLFPLIADCDGKVVKTIGDAIMAFFEDSRSAVEAAQRMQRALAKKNAEWPERERIYIRIGIHAGEALVDSQDVYGDTVNTAARIEAQAGPEEILVSDVVLAEVGEPAPLIRRRGSVKLKGKAQETPLFEVLWRKAEDGLPPSTRPARSRWWIPVGVLLIGGGVAAPFWYEAHRAPLRAGPTQPSPKFRTVVAAPQTAPPAAAKGEVAASPKPRTPPAPTAATTTREPSAPITAAPAPSTPEVAQVAPAPKPSAPRHEKVRHRTSRRRRTHHRGRPTASARVSRAAPSPQAALGTVHLRIVPDGDVYVDGKLVARHVWNEALRLPEGSHQIRVKNATHLNDLVRIVRVTQGGTQEVRLAFPP